MGEWIVLGVCYVAALAFFRLLGGFGGAGRALRSWGQGSSRVGMNAGSSS